MLGDGDAAAAAPGRADTCAGWKGEGGAEEEEEAVECEGEKGWPPLVRPRGVIWIGSSLITRKKRKEVKVKVRDGESEL